MSVGRLLAFLLLVAWPLSAAAADPAAARIDAALKAQVEGKATGVVLIARGGKPIYFKAFGSPTYPAIPKPTRQTAFDIASISKTFTAAAVLRLVDHGRLDLDAPLRRYLPELPAATEDITLRHALSHDTGWPQYLSGDDQTMKTSQEVLAEIAGLVRERKAGTGYRYSDVGFVALALIVERVSGKPFREAMAELVFRPAGLRSTGFYGDARWRRDPVAAEFVKGESKGSPASFHFTWGLGGTGQVTTTADDLLRLNRALTRGRLLSPASRALMFGRGVSTGGRRPVGGPDVLEVSYMAGLFHWTDRKGRHVHFHGGANEFGTNANMFWREEDDLFIAALFNSGMMDETFDRTEFMNALLPALDGD